MSDLTAIKNHEILKPFFERNSEFDLKTFNFFDQDAVTALNWEGLEQEQISDRLKNYQRLLNLHPNSEVVERLIDRGITSANHLARIPPKIFVTEHASHLGLDKSQAESLHQRAIGVRNKTMHLWASIGGTVASPLFRNSPMDAMSAEAKQQFEDLPSYQELFGSLDYCRCEECRSIFGPAAYLVDLLRIIDEYVTKPNAATIAPEFLFTARRPDIGSIELTCANIETLVPTLQIVNERLVASAQETLGLSEPDNVIEQMATTLVYPQALPFNAPLDRVRVLLDRVGASYGSILAAWKASPTTVAARSLGLSPEQQTIVATPRDTEEAIAPYYNVTPPGIVETLADADTFLAKTWSTLAELLALLNQDLSQPEQQAGLQVNFFINQGLSGDWVILEEGDNETYVLENLDIEVLDRIDRLMRLADIVGYPVQDVDWALRCIQGGNAPIIDNNALANLDRVVKIGKKLGLDFANATVLLGPIKTYGQGENDAGTAFDRLFNSPAIVAEQGTYHPSGNPLNPGYSDPPLTWTPNSTATADMAAINRILPGLGIGLSEINALGAFLYGETQQSLTVQVISELYRHVLLSQKLQLPIEIYLIFLGLIDLNTPSTPTAAELTKLVAAGEWLSQETITAYELDYIIRGEINVYVNPLYQPDTVDEWLRGLWVSVSASSPTVDSDIMAQMAVLFGVNNTQIEAVVPMATTAVPLPGGVSSWEEAFLTPGSDGTTPEYSDYVQQVLKWVSRWLVLAQSLKIADTTLVNVAAYPAAYQLPDTFNTIQWVNIQYISQIEKMMQFYGDLQQNLLKYIELASTDQPQSDPLLALQEATGWSPTEVEQLLEGPVQGEMPIAQQLEELQTCFQLMNSFGANPSFMETIRALGDEPASSWTQYTQTAAELMTKIAGFYGTQWDAVWETLSGTLAAHQRDPLLALVLSELNTLYPSIKEPRNVYEFLLTNVEVGELPQVSYIKEALDAAQLYLQRCRLRLEPGVKDMTHIQDVWWEWMMNYRVWQANREIFVYPENYLIPNLRTTVTPQFKTLSQALQQSDVNKAYVGSAFQAYIDGFAETAQVVVVDAYRTRIRDTNTIYLLGRTQTDPYIFYYCSQPEARPWTPWSQIGITIDGSNATLVYAFNRLFVFWNKLEKRSTSSVTGSGGDVTTNNRVVYTVSVKYSFLDQQGKWVQPQILVNQDMVFLEPEGNNVLDEDIFDDLFQMDDPVWNQVFALSVTAQNYIPQPENSAEAERLVVMYGPNLVNTSNTVEMTVPNSRSAEEKDFWAHLEKRADDHNRMVMGQLSGKIALRPVAILNVSLENDVLVQRQELLLADPYLSANQSSASPLSSIRLEMQSSDDVVQLVHSAQSITDNRLATSEVNLSTSSNAKSVSSNSFIRVDIDRNLSLNIFQALKTAGVLDASGNVQSSAMETLDLYTALKDVTVYNQFSPANYAWVLQVLLEHMAATELFSSVGEISTKVIPVGTQPGWFVCFLGAEIFLLMPKPETEGESVFSNFPEGLTIGDPLISPTFAIMSYPANQGKPEGSIDASASAQIFDKLSTFSLIVNGRPASTATLDNVKIALGNLVLGGIISDEQIPYIYLALINAPMLFSDAFISGKIDAEISTDIYTTLQTFSIIDPNGRIDRSILTGANVELALGNLILGQKITQSQIPGIYSTLARAPKAIALTYTNQDEGKNTTRISEFNFDVIRLSTGAVTKVSRALFVGGVDMLLRLETQEIPVIPVLPFERFAPSTTNLNWPSALDATQVDFDGLYGQYYWEIFYHIPMLVAYTLNANQQFQDAQTWLQYIFNPTLPEEFVTADVIVSETSQEISQEQATGIIAQLQSYTIGDPPAPILTDKGEVNPDFTATTDLDFLKNADPSLTDEQVLMTRNILLNYQLQTAASHFWQFRPFRNHTLQTLQEMFSDTNPAIKVYNDNPFDPFAIARLRIGAFEKSTVMQYVDNLIAWGDRLFTQDTRESITAAYMLYVYAYNLLGPKPEEVGECSGSDITLTFEQIKEAYPDGIPQFLIDLEHFAGVAGAGSDTPMLSYGFNDLYVYFCVPENSNLMSRWDTIGDRMYKINNSMNIAGVVRTLPLFQPPLDPLALVKANAAGNNVAATATSSPQLSPYRYTATISVAHSLCGTLIDLGNSLLSALEKNDAEGLEILRTNQASQILEMILQMKEDRIEELQATIKSLQASKGGATERLTFYTDLINQGLSSYEQTNLDATEAALAFNILSSTSRTVATIAYTIPQVGSPFAMTYGGIQLGSSASAASAVFEIGAQVSSYIAQRAATMGSYDRRNQEWELQKKLAQGDIESLEQQIEAANLQLQSAQQDLAVQKESIAQNEEIETYLKAKFTNQELYQWIVGRLAAVYFQTYDLALRVAREAEAAYQFELDSSQTFLAFDYWDSLHKGLTAGEGLRLALNRLDDAYRAGNTRLLEIEKTISLALIAPDQLLALKTTGECNFKLSEALFDYDYPGQYARKIKTISLSIPAVVGPYENIKAILNQTKNSVATDSNIDVVKYLLGSSTTKPTQGLREDWGQNQNKSIAISRGVDDSGLFVLDFEDPRYLPFENTGAVSEWSLKMPLETNRFDFEQVSDVIITLRYTALFDGALETQVKEALSTVPLHGGMYVNGKMQNTAWFAFLSDQSDSTKQTLTLKIDPVQIGFFKSLTYVEVILKLDVAPGITISDGSQFLTLQADNKPAQTPPLNGGQGTVESIHWDGKTLSPSWNFEFALDDTSINPLLTNGFIDPKKLLNLEVIVLYEAKVF